MDAVRERLVVDHLPLADACATKFLAGLPDHVDADAYRGAAREGLVKAAAAFDASRGKPFATFASTRVWYAMQDEARRLSGLARGDFLALREGRRTRIKKRPGRADGTVEVPVPVEMSLQQPVGENGLTVGDTVPDPRDPYVTIDEASEVEWLLDLAGQVLTVREREVLFAAAAGTDVLTLARRFGVSASRVSQLRGAAAGKLRQAAAA